jgi:hypothetical protein
MQIRFTGICFVCRQGVKGRFVALDLRPSASVSACHLHECLLSARLHRPIRFNQGTYNGRMACCRIRAKRGPCSSILIAFHRHRTDTAHAIGLLYPPVYEAVAHFSERTAYAQVLIHTVTTTAAAASPCPSNPPGPSKQLAPHPLLPLQRSSSLPWQSLARFSSWPLQRKPNQSPALAANRKQIALARPRPGLWGGTNEPPLSTHAAPPSLWRPYCDLLFRNERTKGLHTQSYASSG